MGSRRCSPSRFVLLERTDFFFYFPSRLVVQSELNGPVARNEIDLIIDRECMHRARLRSINYVVINPTRIMFI